MYKKSKNINWFNGWLPWRTCVDVKIASWERVNLISSANPTQILSGFKEDRNQKSDTQKITGSYNTSISEHDMIFVIFWFLVKGNKTICFLRWWNCERYIVCEGVHFIMGNRACSIEKIHMTTLFSRVCVCCATVFYCFVSMSMSGLETSLFTALFSHVSFFFYMAKFGQRQTVCMG